MKKILIVDDSRSKRSEIAAEVRKKIGVPVDIIETTSVIGALQVLEKTFVDLLIVDLVLPQRQGDEPQRDGGLRLLNEVLERDEYVKPGFVVGVTAHAELLSTLSLEFNQRGWSLLSYKRDDDAWALGLDNVLSAIAGRRDRGNIEADVCIVTALADPELSAVLALPYHWTQPELLDDMTFVSRGTVDSGGRELRVVASSAPRMGLVSASLLTYKLLSLCNPSIVVMTGICGGFKKEVSIGDAVLATQTWNWQSGKYVSCEGAPHLIPDADVFRVSDGIVASFEQIASDSAFLRDVRHAYEEDKPSTAVNLKLGPMASGSTVLANESVIRGISEQVSRKVSAVDMETYGVYAAVAYSGRDSVKAFSIKGVSDYADAAKDDSFRHYAAYVSSRACDAFLTRYAHRFLGEKSQDGR